MVEGGWKGRRRLPGIRGWWWPGCGADGVETAAVGCKRGGKKSLQMRERERELGDALTIWGGQTAICGGDDGGQAGGGSGGGRRPGWREKEKRNGGRKRKN